MEDFYNKFKTFQGRFCFSFILLFYIQSSKQERKDNKNKDLQVWSIKKQSSTILQSSKDSFFSFFFDMYLKGARS